MNNRSDKRIGKKIRKTAEMNNSMKPPLYKNNMSESIYIQRH
jgi:hypothetical protein